VRLLRRVLALATLIALGAGCVAVPATRRGTLSKRCMQFQEDGDEIVLENHLIDSREGSSGARGARGGGCGCN
jgi:hypothetical protein